MKEYSLKQEIEKHRNKIKEIDERIRFLEKNKQEVVKHLSNNARARWLGSYIKRVGAYEKEREQEKRRIQQLEDYPWEIENAGREAGAEKQVSRSKNVSTGKDVINANISESVTNNIKEDSHDASNAFAITNIMIILLMAAIIFNPLLLQFLGNGEITGLSIADNTYTETVYKLYVENAAENIALNHTPLSLKISGTVLGSGSARVYLVTENRSQILDTAFVDQEGNLGTLSANSSREANTTLTFNNLCIETCALDNFTGKNLMLEIEVENATLYVTKLTYKVDLQEIISLEINITNLTDINLTTIINESSAINESVIGENISGNLSAANVSFDNEINLTKEIRKLSLKVKDRQKQDNANYTVSVRDGKYQLNITKIKKAKQPQGRFTILFEESADFKPAANIEINGLRTLEQNITAVIDTIVPKLNDKKENAIRTEVAAVNSLEMDNATIRLPKNSVNDKINAILSCAEFDVENFSCSSWEKTDIPFSDNGDGTITFTVNHFSGYAGASISIINVQSYPIVGGNWTVRFTTNGTADLVITAIDETTFGSGLPDDLKFLELACNNGTNYNPVAFAFNGSSVIAENYSCDYES